MTITFLFRRINRQLIQIFRTEGRTFIKNNTNIVVINRAAGLDRPAALSEQAKSVDLATRVPPAMEVLGST